MAPTQVVSETRNDLVVHLLAMDAAKSLREEPKPRPEGEAAVREPAPPRPDEVQEQAQRLVRELDRLALMGRLHDAQRLLAEINVSDADTVEGCERLEQVAGDLVLLAARAPTPVLSAWAREIVANAKARQEHLRVEPEHEPEEEPLPRTEQKQREPRVSATFRILADRHRQAVENAEALGLTLSAYVNEAVAEKNERIATDPDAQAEIADRRAFEARHGRMRRSTSPRK